MIVLDDFIERSHDLSSAAILSWEWKECCLYSRYLQILFFNDVQWDLILSFSPVMKTSYSIALEIDLLAVDEI